MRKNAKKQKPFLPMKKMTPAMLTSAVVLAVILLCTSSGLAVSDREEDTVRYLVSQRTEAMNGFFASELTYWEARSILMDIESGRLLEEDLDHLRDFFRTDIEQVTEYEILNVEFTLKDDTVLCAVVEMRWVTEGLNGTECFQCDYSVICEKQGEDFRLVQFF